MTAAACWVEKLIPALRERAAAMAPPSTAAESFALTMKSIVPSMPSPTMGIRTVGSMMVNRINAPPPVVRLASGLRVISSSGGLAAAV